MTFAKQSIFEVIRAIRRLGTLGLFLIGLVIGSTLIAAFSDTIMKDRSGQVRFSADASVGSVGGVSELPSQPWSRVMGGSQFERITDVALTNNQDVVFAGLSLGVGHDQTSHAVLVRTGPQGFVHAQSRVSSPEIGSVSRISLDELGSARLVHWRGLDAAFASVDSGGQVKWTRTLSGADKSLWADIVSAAQGESLVVMAAKPESRADIRVVRLDENGKQLWRRDLRVRDGIESVSMFDSGDGGALVALEALDASGLRALDLVRLDWRGREAWSRTVFEGRDARLADAALEPEGSVVLISGAPSVLYRFDGLGQVNWVRHLPTLSVEGHHQVAHLETGEIQVLAEPMTSAAARRHWLARFNGDGRELWSRTRANRMNATFETAEFLPNGMVIAGGSLMSPDASDTDMLMLAVGRDGSFPSGYGAATALPSINPNTVGMPATNSPMLAASLVVDGSVTLQAAYSADRAAVDRVDPTAVPLRALSTTALAESEIAPDLQPEALELAGAAESELVASPSYTEPAEIAVAPVEVRQISAPVEVTSYAAVEPNLKPQQTLENNQRVERAASSVAETPNRSLSSRVSSTVSHDYRCTFTCLAQSEDLVKYPVRKIISDVSEENASLVSLDIMAMDNGVCLATGGRVYDEPRLPPVCERLN
ncbi:MAG: hypothetical protein MRY64_06865 [Hyphomonadaceae bacterium]|nr:hypothetical protein [Hyphomonadaceae bacterium]